MKDLAIYGAGGLGREFALLVHQINERSNTWNLLGFFDDGKQKHTQVDALEVLGGLHEINTWPRQLSVVVAIADPRTRKSVVGALTNKKLEYPVLVHPQCNPGSPVNVFGIGTVITAGCILTTNIRIGNFNIINLASTIGHDVRTGNFTSIMPGCNISGHVSIGEDCLVGTGSRILQNLHIGDRCKVGAGAVVTKNFGNDVTLKGIPALPGKK